METKNCKLMLLGVIVITLFLFFSANACKTTIVKETEFTPGGEVERSSETVNNELIYELNKVFNNTKTEGVGIFENSNEGLARRTAINLAKADLAEKVQSQIRSESVIYNNADVRDVVENRMHAMIENYKIEFEGYDPDSIKYRVRISIDGESLVREIEKRVVRNRR